MAHDIPSEHRALVHESIEEMLQSKTVPTPQVGFGSAIVRVIEAWVLSYHREAYNGERRFSQPRPLVAGSSAIARIAAVGPDATALQPGQLVYVDCVVRGRDDPSAMFLSAIHEGGKSGSKKLMKDAWRDGTFAEYARVPLENCIPLNETRLCQELGYSTKDLMYIGYLIVPFGGLRDIKLEPGETIVVAPATGGFGGAGVQVAIAMGARVIAMGRNEKELSRLKEQVKTGAPWASVETVKITGDQSTDTAALQAFGPSDALLDFTPTWASKSTHVKSAINVLRRGGRCSLMGFVEGLASDWVTVGNNITMKCKLMYERDDIIQLVKMLERGLFPKGKDFVDPKFFKLDDWKEAMDVAAEHTGIGRVVMLEP